MSETLDDLQPRRVQPRTVAIAAAASLAIHLLALLQLAPWVRHPSVADKPLEGRGPLAVQIVPLPAPPPAPRPAPPAVAQRPAPPPPRAQKKPAPPPKRAPPPVIALDKPSPQAPAPAAPPPVSKPSIAKPPAPAGQDLSAYMEARRKARSEAAPTLAFPNARPQGPAAEDANARANRLAAANLAPGRADAFGYDPNRGGGIFSIQHVAYDYAEFLFYGWNPEARRNTAQLIEVRKGSNPDIQLAIVRRMIAIIREHEKEEFLWESRRLGRYVTLSARARDNAGLEDFMLAEFFDETRRVR